MPNAKRDIGREILQGLREIKRGQHARVVNLPSVASIREKTGLSQERFATLLGVSVRTLQDWERGRRAPSGAARTLLLIAERNPKRGARCRGLQQEQELMSDLERYVKKRKRLDPQFAEGFEVGYSNFKVGVLLSQAREKAGMTQDDVARRLRTKRAATSKIENHAEDIRLSTIQKYAKALGKNLRVEIMG